MKKYLLLIRMCLLGLIELARQAQAQPLSLDLETMAEPEIETRLNQLAPAAKDYATAQVDDEQVLQLAPEFPDALRR
jgi:hypothetical protein